MPGGRIKNVFFDFGNTLAHATRTVDEIWGDVFKELGASFPPKEKLWKVMKEVTAMHGPHIYDYAGKAKAYWTLYDTMVFERLGMDNLAKEGARIAYARFRANKISAYPDAESTLKRLKKEGYVLGIISNYTDELYPDLRSVGLAGYFDHIIVSQSEGVSKPDPRIFKNAMKTAGCDPKRSIHVGNSYEADVVGAKRVGITPVLVDRNGEYGWAECPKVKALAELPVLIKTL